MTADPRFWDAIAETYSKKPVDDPAAFERKIALTKERMRPTDVIADIGCGTGSLALLLAPFAAHVHGLDLSPEMLRIARQKAAEQGVDNVTFHVGAFDDEVPFAPESLDGVCAYSLLHLVDDRPAALDKIFELLKPGGYFVASTACLGHSWVPYRPVLTVMRWLGKAPRAYVLDQQTLAGEIRRAGFVDVSFPDVGAVPTVAFSIATKPA